MVNRKRFTLSLFAVAATLLATGRNPAHAQAAPETANGAAPAQPAATLRDGASKDVRVTPDAIKKTPINPQQLVDMHFQAKIMPTSGSESFIWIEAVQGWVEDENGNLKSGPALVFRNCDIDTALKVQNSGGGGKTTMTQDMVDQKLGTISDMLIENHIKINPRKCKNVFSEADFFPATDVLKETSRFKRIVFDVVRISTDTAALAIGGISATTFSWAKPLEWGAGIVAAKTFTSFFGDKPIADFQNAIAFRTASRRALDIRKRYEANPDGFFITVRVPHINYADLVKGLTSELDDVHEKYCKHSNSSHPNALCDQWEETVRQKDEQYIKPAGDLASPPLLEKLKHNSVNNDPAAPDTSSLRQEPQQDDMPLYDAENIGYPYATLPIDDHHSDHDYTMTGEQKTAL